MVKLPPNHYICRNNINDETFLSDLTFHSLASEIESILKRVDIRTFLIRDLLRELQATDAEAIDFIKRRIRTQQ